MKLLRLLSLLALAGMAACQDAPLATGDPPVPPAAPSAQVRTGWIYGDGGRPVQVRYEVIGGLAIFEGDINLGPAESVARTREELTRKAGPSYGVYIDGSARRWPGGVVPYTISSSFNAAQRDTILKALSHVSANDPTVRFRPRTSEADYVSFRLHASDCNSNVGRTGGGQIINLTSGCAGIMGKVVHEALHALGMFHEHSRCDRDTYVTIHWDNIQPDKKYAFDRQCDLGTDAYGYDEGSIMHYPRDAFPINPLLPTISSKRGLNHLMGQRRAMSTTDVNTLQYLYAPPLSVSITSSGGYPSITPAAYRGAVSYEVVLVWEERISDYELGDSYQTARWYVGTTGPGGSVTDSRPWTGTDTCYRSDGYRTEDVTWTYEITVQSTQIEAGSKKTYAPAPVGSC